MGYATFSTPALLRMRDQIRVRDENKAAHNDRKQADEIDAELKRRAEAHQRPDTGTMELQGLQGYKVTKGNEIKPEAK